LYEEDQQSLLFFHVGIHVLFRLCEDVFECSSQFRTIATIHITVVDHEITIHYVSHNDLVSLHHRLFHYRVGREEHTPVGKWSEGSSCVLEAKTSNRRDAGTTQRIFIDAHERKTDSQSEGDEGEHFREEAH
jgi:hypothetical protein